MKMKSPVVTKMEVIPVAGYDSMLMSLSGAHAPWFTRNLVILTDNLGHQGIGEISASLHSFCGGKGNQLLSENSADYSSECKKRRR